MSPLCKYSELANAALDCVSTSAEYREQRDRTRSQVAVLDPEDSVRGNRKEIFTIFEEWGARSLGRSNFGDLPRKNKSTNLKKSLPTPHFHSSLHITFSRGLCVSRSWALFVASNISLIHCCASHAWISNVVDPSATHLRPYPSILRLSVIILKLDCIHTHRVLCIDICNRDLIA